MCLNFSVISFVVNFVGKELAVKSALFFGTLCAIGAEKPSYERNKLL